LRSRFVIGVGGGMVPSATGGNRQQTLTQSTHVHSFPDTSVACYFRNSRLVSSYVTSALLICLILKYLYFVSKTSLRVHHTLNRQPCGRKGMCAQRDLRYGDFGSHRMSKIEYTNSLMMTRPQRCFRHRTVRK
jgi:hypothetical protein